MLKELSVILLVFNEEKSIKKDIQNIYYFIKKKILKCEIIIIEDFSDDKTYKILKNLKKIYNFNLLRGKSKLGYRKSLEIGLQNAKYKNIFFTESGNKYNFKEFIKFSKHYDEKKIYSGFRNPRYDSANRRMLTFILNLIIRLIFRLNIFDADSGYKLLSKKKYIKYYINRGTFKDFGTAEMIVRMFLHKEIIIEKKISYFQRPDNSKQFNLLKIITKSFNLIINLILLSNDYRKKSS